MMIKNHHLFVCLLTITMFQPRRFTCEAKQKVDQKRVKIGGANRPKHGSVAEKNCKAIKCDFEAETLCNWMSIGKLATPKQAKIAKGPGLKKDEATSVAKHLSFLQGGDSPEFMDKLEKLTGMFMAWYSFHGHLGYSTAKDTWYAGGYMSAGQRASMASDVEFIVDTDIDISFYITGGASLKFCCGLNLLEATETCPLQSGKSEIWLHKKVSCPKGTKLLSFFCSNNESGGMDGACAVDDVKMSDTQFRQVYVPPEASPNLFSIKMSKSHGWL